MSSQKIALPIIDLGRVKVDRQEEAKGVVDILENFGFANIDNVEGIDYKDCGMLASGFFSKPFHLKKKIIRKQLNDKSSNVYRVEGQPNRKRGIRVRSRPSSS